MVRKRAGPVDVLRQTALARARLAGNEDGHACARDLAYGLQDLLHGRAVVDERHRRLILILAGLFYKLTVQLRVFGGPLHEGGKLRVVHGLGQIAVGPELHGLHGAFYGAHARHHDEGKRGVHDAHAAQHLKSAHARHGKIAHHHVDASRGNAGQRPLSVQRRFGLPALAGKQQCQNFMPFRIVVHHKNLISALSVFTHSVTLKHFLRKHTLTARYHLVKTARSDRARQAAHQGPRVQLSAHAGGKDSSRLPDTGI